MQPSFRSSLLFVNSSLSPHSLPCHRGHFVWWVGRSKGHQWTDDDYYELNLNQRIWCLIDVSVKADSEEHSGRRGKREKAELRTQCTPTKGPTYLLQMDLKMALSFLAAKVKGEKNPLYDRNPPSDKSQYFWHPDTGLEPRG